MTLEQRTYLAKRLITLRKSILELGRYGRSTGYYLRELAILENTVRGTRAGLEQLEYQERLPL